MTHRSRKIAVWLGAAGPAALGWTELHNDRDLNALGRHVGLRVWRP